MASRTAAATAPRGSSSEPGWLTRRRATARAAYERLPLPQPGDPGHAWDFTKLDGLELEAYAPAPAGAEPVAPEGRILATDSVAARLVRVDAETVAADGGAEAAGAVVLPLERAATERPELLEGRLGALVDDLDVFAAHNSAAWAGGVLVHVPSGVALERPVSVVVTNAAAGTAQLWRTLVVVEPGAEVTVLEEWASHGAEIDGYFNATTELHVGEGARLRYVGAQDLSDQTWLFANQRASLARDAELDWAALGLGSKSGKVRMETDLRGQGSTGRVTGAYLGQGRRHLDYDTTQEHFAPHTTSDLAFRGVLQGRSSAVWRGMIRVDQGAQRTDAFQENRNLLLSKRAHADSIPGLEIEANDVRCTHAATIGQVDRDQVFYLMSRGLRRAEAERLIVRGFFEDVLDRLGEGEVRAAAAAAMDDRLG